MTREVFVHSEVEDGICHVRLDRPDRLNAVSEELYADLEAVLEGVAGYPTVRAIVLTGEGRAFCAGADLKAHADRTRTPAERRAYVWAGQRICRFLQQMPQPVVAGVHGHAIGAGAEIAWSADVVIAAEDVQFRLPEIGLGTFVGGGVVQRLPLLVGHLRAKQLLLLGRPVSGVQAAAWGLATEAVASERVQERAVEVARELADQPARPLRLAKQALNRAGALTPDEALTYEAESLLECMGTDDWERGVQTFTDDRGDREGR
ncbi:enoyl-CoA hydratase/isomerase family protein [Egibacter rhizosphaerae]|uniref:Enoyl-CoA hydratase/isomerase family protein n=1 Tax=Egibacter rhizosphaerae TaxID=1670831 RepID=A0A411YDY4_9ACTN|nr:enoyl-CoA hydratase/isomerase family protein [Egibacter rhizosphaerae]QBI19415.1 enoyl-CoA hydratase/isomerase family protein [Egibacter rhizosphaerae]